MATKKIDLLQTKATEAQEAVRGAIRDATAKIEDRIDRMREKLERHDRRHEPRAQLKVGGQR